MLMSFFYLLDFTVFRGRTRLGFAFIDCNLFLWISRFFFGIDLAIEADDFIDEITFPLPCDLPGFILDGLHSLGLGLLLYGG